MAIKIVVPRVGEKGGKYETVKLVEWKGKEGEWVEKGANLFTVEGEKATVDVEAEASGFLHILVEEGAKTVVGNVVGCIAETKEELSELQKMPLWKLTQKE
jgi:pyruvate dehydrogenase E2 component (dihydrolipoamide acetyltransferase)